jgi:hypothetical protein
MLVIYLRTKFHPPSCNGSRTQQVLRGPNMLLFYILRNSALSKVPYFFKTIVPCVIAGPRELVDGDIVSPTSQVRTSAMLLLQIVRRYRRTALCCPPKV